MANDPKQVQAVFLDALKVPADQRTTFLDLQCADDTELRLRVMALLKAHDDSGEFLDQPAAILDLEAMVDTRLREGEWPLTDDPLPIRVGRYHLLERLGEGGMGTVYMAEQLEPVRRRVALKLIKPGMDSTQVLRRFEQERQALALMDHPNIARVLDAGATGPMSLPVANAPGSDGRPYFVMELVQGQPITRHCDEARPTLRERLALFLPVCHALQHAHQKGVIHRDVKPSNVLVATHDGQPVPKVIDFGVAKAVGQKLTDVTLSTESGQVVGTLEYMSPEQAGPGRDGVDTRADVYALGAVLYELLTGQTPLGQKLRGATLIEMLQVIREEEPVPPSRAPQCPWSREVSGDLDWIVLKALEKDRARRYASAGELARDVERHLACEPVEAGPPSTRYRLGKFLRRHRGIAVALCVVATSLLVGVAGLTAGLVRARDATAKERDARELAEHRLDQLERANELLASIFRDLDPLAVEKEDKSLNVLLGERLNEATARLDAESVGDPLRVARLQQSLGSSQLGLGHFDKAIVLLEKARDTREALLGREHPDTLTSINSLSCAYREAGRLKEALALSRDVFKLRKQLPNPTDPATLSSMNNLATDLVDMGLPKEALPLLEQALKLRHQVLGPMHRDTLESTANLASVYRKLGRLPEALPLFEQALKLRQETLGPRHPLTLRSMSALGSALLEAGRPADARPLCEKALEGMKEKLGPRHRETIGALGELAVAYRRLKRLGEALPLAEETLRLRRERFGVKHPDTLVSMNNLAAAYWEANRLEDALALFEETLKLTRQTLCPGHPDILRAMMNVASGYRKAGRLPEAAKLYESALELLKAEPGPGHPLTLTCMDYLAGTYLADKRPAQALPMWREYLRAQRKRLERDELRLAGVLAQIGQDLMRGEQYAEAEPLLRESYEALKRAKDSVGLRESTLRLVKLYEDWGKPAEASRWRKELEAMPK